jgi:hypothetical protein
MKKYSANASVIYIDANRRRIDTFVIFDTDLCKGLTHINHKNLKVVAQQLELYPKTICVYHLPLDDAFSFEHLKKLRDKYKDRDKQPEKQIAKLERADMFVLAKAS